MLALYDPARHEKLEGLEWSASRARDAIASICRDAESAFDRDRLWPLHPADDGPDISADGILRGLYLGATGTVHALSHLAEAGLHVPTLDGAAIMDGLQEAALVTPDEEGAGASLLAGSSGILLVAHRLAPSAATTDALAGAIAANVEHPSNELLLGAPGTMLAARVMHARTAEGRFAELWRASARTLLARQATDGLWTQELYGDRLRYVGAAHGFAGNVRALTGAREWLDDPQAVEARAAATARALAIMDGDVASWPALSTVSDRRTAAGAVVPRRRGRRDVTRGAGRERRPPRHAAGRRWRTGVADGYARTERWALPWHSRERVRVPGLTRAYR